MTIPIPGQVAPPAARSPFAGGDVCTLAGLELQPGSHRPHFDEDVWLLDGLAHAPKSMPATAKRWQFSRIRNRLWRQVAKELVFALLAPHHERVIDLPHAFRSPLSPASIYGLLTPLTQWFNYLTEQDIHSLAEVTQEHCDAYRLSRSHRRDGTGTLEPGSMVNIIKPIQYLSLYGELFTADAYAPGFLPWDGRSSNEVAGKIHSGENTTQPVPDHVLQPLLAAALYLINTVGPHVAPELVRQRERVQAPRGEMKSRTFFTQGSRQLVLDAIEHHRRNNIPFPRVLPSRIAVRLNRGWSPDDPLLSVNMDRVVQQTLQVRTLSPRLYKEVMPAWREAAAVVGAAYEYAQDAVLVPRQDTPEEKVPWSLPLSDESLPVLGRIVQGACLILTGALTGMRSSELAELNGDSCLPPTAVPGGGRRYRLASRLIKGRKQFGGVPEEWVVIEEAYRAVEMAAQIAGPSADTALFGRKLNVGVAYRQFRDWVNGPAGQRLGLAHIPDGPVNGRMLRRTLAVCLAYRPGGLLAAKIHLKHVQVATTEGYAHKPGGAQSFFLSEVEEAEREHHMELTAAAFREFQAGVMPAGPGARDVIAAFEHIDAELTGHTAGEPKIMDSDRQLVNLLRQQSRFLHTGPANYCWFRDPGKALCLKLAGVTATKDSKPMAGLCDSARCPQATHHPGHRAVWADNAERTRVFLGTIPKRHKAERQRVRADLERSLRVLEEIDAAGNDPAGGE